MIDHRLEGVYRLHRQGLFTLALAITRSVDRAEDAVQNAFAGLSARDSLPEDPVPYVFAAVRNAAIEIRRTERRNAVPPASIYNGGSLDPAVRAERYELNQKVRSAMEEIGDEQREAIVLRIYGGLTFEQMAEALAVPLQTAAARYRRGIEALKQGIGRAHE